MSDHELELDVAWQRHVTADRALLDSLLARHREKHRRYHTATHVGVGDPPRRRARCTSRARRAPRRGRRRCVLPRRRVRADLPGQRACERTAGPPRPRLDRVERRCGRAGRVDDRGDRARRSRPPGTAPATPPSCSTPTSRSSAPTRPATPPTSPASAPSTATSATTTGVRAEPRCCADSSNGRRSTSPRPGRTGGRRVPAPTSPPNCRRARD